MKKMLPAIDLTFGEPLPTRVIVKTSPFNIIAGDDTDMTFSSPKDKSNEKHILSAIIDQNIKNVCLRIICKVRYCDEINVMNFGEKELMEKDRHVDNKNVNLSIQSTENLK